MSKCLGFVDNLAQFGITNGVYDHMHGQSHRTSLITPVRLRQLGPPGATLMEESVLLHNSSQMHAAQLFSGGWQRLQWALEGARGCSSSGDWCTQVKYRCSGGEGGARVRGYVIWACMDPAHQTKSKCQTTPLAAVDGGRTRFITSGTRSLLVCFVSCLSFPFSLVRRASSSSP